ncbi:hypothetical protein NM688_g1332 [Phlebia brevispora]|uniref:Uncharacterized protein n=1 Tax=Phlebia brevispora TaxID=194682 RepID=A0ACC1TBL0_9APHY|nr:hypothetical protein NM688_g1332 [Phlebia brevispora]
MTTRTLHDFYQYRWKRSPEDPSYYCCSVGGSELIEDTWHCYRDGEEKVFLGVNLELGLLVSPITFLDRCREAWIATRRVIPAIASHKEYTAGGRPLLTYRVPKRNEDTVARAKRTVKIDASAKNLDDLRVVIGRLPIPSKDGDQTFLCILPFSDTNYGMVLFSSHVPSDSAGIKAIMNTHLTKLTQYIIDPSLVAEEAAAWGPEVDKLLPFVTDILPDRESKEVHVRQQTLGSAIDNLGCTTLRLRGFEPEKPGPGVFRHLELISENFLSLLTHAAMYLMCMDDKPSDIETTNDAVLVNNGLVNARDRLEPHSQRNAYSGCCLYPSAVWADLSLIADSVNKGKKEQLLEIAKHVRKQHQTQKEHPSLLPIEPEQIDLTAGQSASGLFPATYLDSWYYGDEMDEDRLDAEHFSGDSKIIAITNFFQSLDKTQPGPSFRTYLRRGQLELSVDFNEDEMSREVVHSFTKTWADAATFQKCPSLLLTTAKDVMPGPGNRKHKGRRGASHSQPPDLSDVNVSTVLDAFNVEEVNGADRWESVVFVLCRVFNLPDLGTRSGLKNVHANFPSIQRGLEAAYDKYQDNEKVRGGIVGIWARMCVDAILRDKLFKGGQSFLCSIRVLERIVPLLDIRSTRFITLQALSTITHHSGVEVRLELAKHTPTLLRLMDEFPENIPLNELLVGVLSHAVGSVLIDESRNSAMMRKVEVASVLRHILATIRTPNATPYLLSHAFTLFTAATQNCRREIMAVPSITNFLVACLRCNELTTRCSAINSFMRLLDPDSETGYVQIDLEKLLPKLRNRLPDHLVDNLVDFNFFECDTMLIPRCAIEYQKAMQRCAQDRNLCALGRTIATLIPQSESAVTDGAYQAINERTGKFELVDTGLPFKMWLDGFPLCAKALRAQGSAGDLDMADTIEMKFLLLRKRPNEAVQLAQRAIARLRACKKGLKCKQMTPWVRSALLVRAVDHAAQMGLNVLSDLTAKESAHEEGLAFLMSAHEDAKTFVTEVPPDARHMPKMLDWYIILTIALQGNELSADLRELDEYLKKLELTKEFSRFFETRQQRTTLRLTRDLVTSRYKKAVEEWGSAAARLDGPLKRSQKSQEESAAKAEDNLSAWLEGLQIDGEESPTKYCTHPKINGNLVALYRCSYCSSPSAVLRKCGGCGNTRYCDSACQKLHWAEHKAACKAAQAAST